MRPGILTSFPLIKYSTDDYDTNKKHYQNKFDLTLKKYIKGCHDYITNFLI